VPLRLRNAPTARMQQDGYGDGYRYPHDETGGVAMGEVYLPDQLSGAIFYEPTERGEEAKIKARLGVLRAQRRP